MTAATTGTQVPGPLTSNKEGHALLTIEREAKIDDSVENTVVK